MMCGGLLVKEYRFQTPISVVKLKKTHPLASLAYENTI